MGTEMNCCIGELAGRVKEALAAVSVPLIIGRTKYAFD
jgi:hypothetical protein